MSFDIPEYTGDVTGLGALRILDAIRESGVKTRFYQASSSEMFGKVQEVPQKESTPFYPRSPYGCAKVYAYWLTVNYREAYNLFACNGILFNHESPRRGETFVSRKITRAVARALRRAWKTTTYTWETLPTRAATGGYAPEYVEAMWLIAARAGDAPDDYVIATGETHAASRNLSKKPGLMPGRTGLERARQKSIHATFAPPEVDLLVGDASKAKRMLHWSPKAKSLRNSSAS